jgi:hypothetical protein
MLALSGIIRLTKLRPIKLTKLQPWRRDLLERRRHSRRGTLRRGEALERRHLDRYPQTLSLPELADWISVERLCFPFLTFQLSASGNQSDWDLKLTAPKGVKALLRAEFPEARRTE